MNIDMLQKNGWIIFKALVGSHAYGTSTPTSDTDYRGLFMVPLNHRVTILQPFTEVGQEKPTDEKYYEVAKYFELAADCNPNIIEYLFMPDDCILFTTPIMQKIIANRHLFISKKAYHTFSGYAFAQIKKAKGENKWVNNPKSETPPQREDFCWVVPIDRIHSIGNWRSLGVMPCRPIPIQDYNNRLGGYFSLNNFHAAALEHVPNTYRLYHYGADSKGVFRNGNLACESIPMDDEYPRFWGLLIYNDQEYQKAMLDWKNYWTWVKERNPNRWVSQESGQVDYDCYVDSETEFLTNHGWKHFDAVDENDLLASVSGENTLVYQKPNARLDKTYSGPILVYENRYTKFAITPQHKLRLSFCHRSFRNKFSSKYDANTAQWQLISANDYFKGRLSHAHLTVATQKRNKDYPISDEKIQLIGAFLSEGSIIFNKNSTCQAIFVSQNKDKPLSRIMESMTEVDVKLTTHTGRGKDRKRIEHTYRIQNAELAQEFLNDMGHGCHNKHLPCYAFDFSPRQVKLLLQTILMGDGHKHVKGHSVYYSTSEQLINDLQLLLFINGQATQIYGPYNYDYPNDRWDRKPSYQLFIPKKDICFATINKQSPRFSNSKCGWIKRQVSRCRVVCFDMPNGVLITRNSKKIAVQGNCKNMQHCMRLLLSGEAILKTGVPTIRFEGDELQYLRDIRAGKFTHEKLMAEVEVRMENLKSIYEKSTLPHSPDKQAIDELYREIVLA